MGAGAVDAVLISLLAACGDPVPGEPLCVESFAVDVPEHVDGVVEVLDDGTVLCLASEAPGDWCRRHLPCWDEPECPPLDRFVYQTGWRRGSSFDFTHNGPESYNASALYDCSSSTSLPSWFFTPIGDTYSSLIVVSPDQPRSLSIGLDSDPFHPVPVPCGAGGALADEVWWGEVQPIDYSRSRDECDVYYRGDADVPIDTGGPPTGTHEEGARRGCNAGRCGPDELVAWRLLLRRPSARPASW